MLYRRVTELLRRFGNALGQDQDYRLIFQRFEGLSEGWWPHGLEQRIGAISVALWKATSFVPDGPVPPPVFMGQLVTFDLQEVAFPPDGEAWLTISLVEPESLFSDASFPGDVTTVEAIIEYQESESGKAFIAALKERQRTLWVTVAEYPDVSAAIEEIWNQLTIGWPLAWRRREPEGKRENLQEKPRRKGRPENSSDYFQSEEQFLQYVELAVKDIRGRDEYPSQERVVQYFNHHPDEVGGTRSKIEVRDLRRFHTVRFKLGAWRDVLDSLNA